MQTIKQQFTITASFFCDRWFPMKYLCFMWWISENRYAQCFIGHVSNVPNYYTDFNSKCGWHIMNCKLKQFWADNVYSDVSVIPRVFLGILVGVSAMYLSRTEGPRLWFQVLSEFFLNLEHLDWPKIHFPAWSMVFWQALF